jgi:hypothetical protein
LNDATGRAPGTPGGGGAAPGQFTENNRTLLYAAAQQAGGNFSGETQNYIDRLAGVVPKVVLLIR